MEESRILQADSISSSAAGASAAADLAARILQSWTALEVLEPPSFQDPKDLANGDSRRILDIRKKLPWEAGRKSRPKFRLYYHLPLGAV